jgi:hypothetical protein
MRERARASDYAEFVSNLKHVASVVALARLTLLAMPASARGHGEPTEFPKCLMIWMCRREST